MEKLYTVSENKTWSWLWLRSNFRLKMNKVGKTTRPFKYDLNQIPYNDTMTVMNRLKGLDLVETVTEEQWTEVQEAVTKTIPNKKKCKKAGWLSQEGLQMTEERREAKSKGGRGRYPNECRVTENNKER